MDGPSKRPRLAPQRIVMPHFGTLRELALFAVLKHFRGPKCHLPADVVAEAVSMMRRLCMVGHFLLSCFLGPQLSVLDLSGSHQVDDDTLAVAAAECPNLARLNVSGCARVARPAAALSSMRALTHLNASNCGRVVSLAGLGPLHELMVQNLSVLVQLPTDLSLVTALDCAGCSKLAPLFQTQIPRQIESLNLGDSSLASDATLLTLAEHCSGLKRLWISGSMEVTDEGLVALLTRATALEEVRLNSLMHVSQKIAFCLARLASLRVCCILNCPGVTSLFGLAHLERLEVDGNNLELEGGLAACVSTSFSGQKLDF